MIGPKKKTKTTTQFETQRDKRIKNTDERVRDIEDAIKRTNRYTIRVRGEEGKNWAEEITTKKISN